MGFESKDGGRKCVLHWIIISQNKKAVLNRAWANWIENKRLARNAKNFVEINYG